MAWLYYSIKYKIIISSLRKYTILRQFIQISVFQNIYMDFLTDFVEGVQDFRAVGDSSYIALLWATRVASTLNLLSLHNYSRSEPNVLLNIAPSPIV